MNILLIALCSLSYASAGTVTWTGAGGNGLWSYGPNWNTNIIPTARDDVVIGAGQSTSVTVAAPAQAQSITIGKGQSGVTTLIIQSTVTVGAGGVSVYYPSMISLQASPSSPFSSSGNVTFNGNNTFIFTSGAISGSGSWVNLAESTIDLIDAGEKLIFGTTLYNYGSLIIGDRALVQLESKGQIMNYGSVLVSGSPTLLSQDNTGLFTSQGQFIYSGPSSATLTFQVSADLEGGISVPTGTVVIQSAVTASTFEAPRASAVVVGSLEIEGKADSGFATLTINPGASFMIQSGFTGVGTFTLNQGKMVNNGFFAANDIIFNGGSLSGTGAMRVSDATINPSNNVPITLNTAIILMRNIVISAETTILLDGQGNIQFLAGSMLTINAGVSFQKIGGNPFVSMNGITTMYGDLTTNTNIGGSGLLRIMGRTLTLQAVSFASGDIDCESCNIKASASSIQSGNLIGNGTYTIQAEPTATFAGVWGQSLEVTAGQFSATNLTLGTLNFVGGNVVIQSSSTIGTLDFIGGTFQSANSASVVPVVTRSSSFLGPQPKTISAISLTATTLSLKCGTQCTIMLENEAQVLNA